MMDKKWTPGPWAVKGDRGIRGANGECVASTYCAAPAEDAQLIAAAPELYDALQAMLDYCNAECGSKIYPGHQANQALAKARGETQ